jgi:hypothetical protein
VKWAAAIVLIAACGHDDAAPTRAAPTEPSDARVSVARAPLPRGSWRTPILLITKAGVELRWRAPGGPDEIAVTQPLARWSCPPLHAALTDETKRAWGRTPDRPAASEELLASVDPAVPDATVFAVLRCVNDPSDPRPPYRDVVIRPEPAQ